MWRFEPILKTTIWGGNRIAAFKGGAPFPELGAPVGETYELSGMPGRESVVADGPQAGMSLTQLIDAEGERLMGRRLWKAFGNRFPLLVKFVDAASDLSVQVHPDDELASTLDMPNGKSEMWYVLEASDEAHLCAGFKEPVKAEDYNSLVHDGGIVNTLKYVSVHPGEVYYLPAGTVHSLGKGCMVLEIQQPSEVTYRIYDFDREDKDGRRRELHTDMALKALNLKHTGSSQVLFPDETECAMGLISTRHFTVNRLHLRYRLHRDYKDVESFKVLVVVSGEAEIDDGTERRTATRGTLLLIAADRREVTITPRPETIIIETYI